MEHVEFTPGVNCQLLILRCRYLTGERRADVYTAV